ncbi:MAG TPA: hypothetical protein VFS20_12890, partial [Longimicrobium sp.]|nr:hypothetical protein [Longimicrobium sp.]
MPEVILPGTYITVRDEGLITAGRIATGYIGMVGTAERGPVEQVVTLGSFIEARNIFGEADAWKGGSSGELTLIRALELAFNNGASTVYAVRAAAKTGTRAVAAATLAVKKGTAAVLTLSAKSPGTWGNAIQVRLAAPEGDTSGVKVLDVTLGTQRESHRGANAGALAEAINRDSAILSARADRAGDVPDDVAVTVSLANGSNGEATGAADYARALEPLENEIV